MGGEVVTQNVKELHQPRGDVFRQSEGVPKGHLVAHAAQQL